MTGTVSKDPVQSKQEEIYFISENTTLKKCYSSDSKSGGKYTYKNKNRPLQVSQPIDSLGNSSMEDKLNNEYSWSDFQEEITTKVADFLRPHFDQVVLLLGAGASIVPKKKKDGSGSGDATPNVSYGLPMSGILEAIDHELSAPGSGLYSMDCMKQLAFPSGLQSSDDNDLESILSQFEKAEEFVPSDNSTNYTATLKRIREIIVDKTKYGFDDQCMKHLALINFFNRMVSDGNKLSIVTTNYDTLIEEAAAKGSYTVFDGFTFSDTPVFDAKMFDWNLVKDVPNLKTQEVIYDKKVINLLKIHGSLTWKKDDKVRTVRRVSKSENLDSPLLIFPSTNKYEQSYRAPYSDLFYKFRELLNRPRTLLVSVGFSFGDTHIFEMVNDALRHNDGLSMLFTNYSIDSDESSNLGKLKQLIEEGYRVAFLRAALNDDLPTYLKMDENA